MMFRALLNLRAEIVTRILQTDYLDDVSGRYIDPSVFANHLSGVQLNEALLLNDRHKPGAVTAHPDGIRGRPNNNDSYITFNVKLGLNPWQGEKTIGYDKLQITG